MYINKTHQTTIYNLKANDLHIILNESKEKLEICETLDLWGETCRINLSITTCIL